MSCGTADNAVAPTLRLLVGAVVASACFVLVAPSAGHGREQQAAQALARVSYRRAVVVRPVSQGLQTPQREPTTGLTFRHRQDVFVEDNGAEVRRFSVYAPTDDLAGLTLAVAKAMGLFWAATEARVGRLNSRLRAGPLDVWLCPTSGPGAAEQSRRNLYIYEVMAERSGLEWLRTLAHEFGHFVLPGPVGYREPEPWSNGMLGERLFLSWLRDDLREGKLEERDLPFATSADLTDYCAKQPDALADRIATRGPDRNLLASLDKKGMDEANALLIYLSRLHGARVLHDILAYLPPRTTRGPGGLEFLEAYERWADDAEALSYHLAMRPAQCVYWPTGRRNASWKGVEAGHWRIEGVSRRSVTETHTVSQPQGRWTRLELELPATELATPTIELVLTKL